MSNLFVGREAEITALVDLRRGLSRSRGVVALIAGDAGIGKSRLLAEFERALRANRTPTFVRAECRDTVAETLGPVLTIASALSTEVPQGALPDNARRALAMLFPERRAPGEASIELPQSRLFAGTLDLIRAVAAKRATVIAIEDLHWADAATMEWLVFAAPRLATLRVMIVGTYRADHLDAQSALAAALGRLERSENAVDLRLGPLGDDEIAELVHAGRGAASDPSPELVERIVKRAEGNPFFAEELLKSELAGRGRHARSLPISIRASILERLRLFEAGEREIVALAAAFGSRFTVADLVALSGRPVEEVARALQHARQLSVVVGDSANGHFSFRHGLTRQTIYEDVLATDTRTLHGRVLALLESRSSVERDSNELAHHASRSGDRAKALAYAELAGDRAIALRGYVDACAAFERALEAAIDDEDRARILERLGYASELGGRFDLAIAHCRRALDLRVARGDVDDALRVFTRLAGCRSNSGEESVLDEVEAFADRFADRASAVALGGLLVLGARMASAQDDHERARRLLRRIDDPAQLPARARVNYFTTELNDCAAHVDLAGWQRAADRMEEIALELSVDLAAIALCTVAQTAINLGLNDRVESALSRSETLIREGGSFGIETFREAVAANGALVRGRLTAAAKHLRAAYARPEIFVAQTLAAQAAPTVATHLQDDSIAASPVGERVLQLAREGRIYSDEALVLAAHAERLAKLGRVAEARAVVAEAMTAAHLPHPQMDRVFVVAAAHGAEADFDELLRLVAERSSTPSTLRAAHGDLARAHVAARRGDDAVARDRATRAATGYRLAGWPLAEAEALAVAGRRDEAQAILERCGSHLGRRRETPRRAESERATALAALSGRERAVAELVSEGLTNATIADRFDVSVKTIEKYLSTIYDKLEIRSRAQLAAVVSRHATLADASESVAN